MIPRGYLAGITGKKNTKKFGGCFEKWDAAHTSQSAFFFFFFFHLKKMNRDGSIF
jgi:hypothetical protein